MMDISTARRGRRAALAGALAAAALCGTTAAQADAHRGGGHGHGTPTAEECAARLTTIEAQFRVIEERNGYEAATRWWQRAWARYHDDCVLGR